ncbi:hypothetical protein [Virgibacillus sp.]|nr:hypothetical protein [Virgibacillus sp.]
MKDLKVILSFIYLRSFGRVKQVIGRLECKVATPAGKAYAWRFL